ncbi:hypothetical protein [Bacillus paralicheniformis]|uniref:hypothetical protein n=1 Tax=Bacillus paralicheniformis TaxID=1648923 RepID=UPI002DB8D979|nr:hypothetical protein [Bacillus paralicheniformis]MEC1866747.1 hypothetical protein [Bacillus paralicheniformis]
MDSRSTVSTIRVWRSKKGDSFNLHIGAMGIMITVHKDKQPKSYEKIEDWLSRGEEQFITPTTEEE